MEFFADASSILVALYDILFFIFNFFDNFYAYHSLSQNIFFFKDIKEDNNYNIFPKKNQIQKIISLIENNEKNNNSNIFTEDNKESKNTHNKNKKGIEFSKTRELYSEIDVKGIQIYNIKHSKAENNKKI